MSLLDMDRLELEKPTQWKESVVGTRQSHGKMILKLD